MRINFRQGIVTAPPGFLRQVGSSVDLVIAPISQVNVAFADGTADYLYTERQTIVGAWAGPFTPGSQSYWLYWDINVLTGQRTFGYTTQQPVNGTAAPITPNVGQHWFDTTTNTMKVFNLAGRWVKHIRVFAAKLDGGSVLISTSINSPQYEGTQVGALNNILMYVGALVFDVNGDAVKRAGVFFTTEDVVVAGVASAAQIKIGAIAV